MFQQTLSAVPFRPHSFARLSGCIFHRHAPDGVPGASSTADRSGRTVFARRADRGSGPLVPPHVTKGICSYSVTTMRFGTDSFRMPFRARLSPTVADRNPARTSLRHGPATDLALLLRSASSSDRGATDRPAPSAPPAPSSDQIPSPHTPTEHLLPYRFSRPRTRRTAPAQRTHNRAEHSRQPPSPIRNPREARPFLSGKHPQPDPSTQPALRNIGCATIIKLAAPPL